MGRIFASEIWGAYFQRPYMYIRKFMASKQAAQMHSVHISDVSVPNVRYRVCRACLLNNLTLASLFSLQTQIRLQLKLEGLFFFFASLENGEKFSPVQCSPVQSSR